MADELVVLQRAVRVGDERPPQVSDLAAADLRPDVESEDRRVL